jgi:hypothetical protein
MGLELRILSSLHGVDLGSGLGTAGAIQGFRFVLSYIDPLDLVAFVAYNQPT